MSRQLVGLSRLVDEPDGAVRHSVGSYSLVLAVGIGCHLPRDGNLLVGNLVKTGDEVFAASVVEEQGLVVAPAGADNTVVEAACAYELVGGKVEEADAVLTDNE